MLFQGWTQDPYAQLRILPFFLGAGPQKQAAHPFSAFFNALLFLYHVVRIYEGIEL